MNKKTRATRRAFVLCALIATFMMVSVGVGTAAAQDSEGQSADDVSLVTQSYAPMRSIIGTPLTSYGIKNEGSDTAYWFYFYSDKYRSTDDAVTYYAVFTLPSDETSVVRFSQTYLNLTYNFGYGGTSYFINKNDPSTWPANLQTGLNIVEWTDSEVILEYTFSASDIQWCIDNPKVYEFSIAPTADILKLPDTDEAAYFTYYNKTTQKDDTTGYDESLEVDRPFVTDKKTVEIGQKIAPVTNGTVGTYTTDKVYLSAGQQGSVQDTLSRPVGVLASGDCEVNCAVPSGMTYVAGSATAVSSSGITVAVDDSSGAPKVDFSALPVGDTVTVTYKVAAPASVTDYTEFNTADTLTNKYQRDLVAYSDNTHVSGNVYTQPEYDTTVSSTFVMTTPLSSKSLDSVVSNGDGTLTAAYTITLSNPTSTEITAYELSDDMTGGSIIASSVTGADWDATAGTFTIASIPAATSDTEPGTASFSYEANVTDPSQIAANVLSPLGSEWSLSKTRVTGDGETTAATDTLQVGDDVWYLVKVDNSRGASEIPADASVVTDTFRNLDYVGSSTTSGTISVSGNTATWEPGEVAANETASAWMHFTVNASALTDTTYPFDVVNTAATLTHSAVTQDPVLHVALTKTESVEQVVRGDKIIYTITAYNDSNLAATGYWVKDYVPAGTTYASCDASGTYGTMASGQGFVSWFFGSIAPGESKTMTMTVTVNDDVEDGAVIPNTALGQVTGSITPPSDVAGTDPTGISNEVDATVSVPSVSPTALPKTGDSMALPLMLVVAAAGTALVLYGARRRRSNHAGR